LEFGKGFSSGGDVLSPRSGDLVLLCGGDVVAAAKKEAILPQTHTQQTERQTDRQTDRLTDRQIDRQIETDSQTQTDITHRHTHTQTRSVHTHTHAHIHTCMHTYAHATVIWAPRTRWAASAKNFWRRARIGLLLQADYQE